MDQVVERIRLVNENEKIIHATILLVFIKIVIDKKIHYVIIRVVSKSVTKQIKIKGSEKLLLYSTDSWKDNNSLIIPSFTHYYRQLVVSLFITSCVPFKSMI